MRAFRNTRSRLLSLATVCCLLLAGVVGCGGGKTSGVSGKVMYNGKAVTGGSLTFNPIATGKEAGKPGAANVKPDGNYTAGTHKENDGLIVGKHKVTYTPPEMPYPPGRDPMPEEKRPLSGFENLVPKVTEIEVKPGKNTIDIELIPGPVKPN